MFKFILKVYIKFITNHRKEMLDFGYIGSNICIFDKLVCFNEEKIKPATKGARLMLSLKNIPSLILATLSSIIYSKLTILRF